MVDLSELVFEEVEGVVLSRNLRIQVLLALEDLLRYLIQSYRLQLRVVLGDMRHLFN